MHRPVTQLLDISGSRSLNAAQSAPVASSAARSDDRPNRSFSGGEETMKRRSFVLCGLAAGVLLAAGGALVQWKPDKPVTIIVPWDAGGSTDQMARVLARELEKALGQTVVVVNKPGASGSIGTKAVLEGAKDGTLIAS